MAELLKDELRRLLREKKVIVFAGTGVTAQATGNAPCATWKGLLEDGIIWCQTYLKPDSKWEETVRLLLATNDVDAWVTAAKKIEDRLTQNQTASGDKKKWLAASVGKLAVTQPAILNALHLLGAPIVTTNYDGLLSQHTGLPHFTWRQKDQLHDFLRGNKAGIFHLHGHWEEHDSVVFDFDSYASVRRDALVHVFRDITAMYNILFVGFGAGLNDSHIQPWRQWMQTVLPDLKEGGHYWLVRNAEVDVAWDYFQQGKIRPVGYGDTYDELVPCLISLTKEADSTATVPYAASEKAPMVLPSSETTNSVNPGPNDLLQNLGAVFSELQPGGGYKFLEEFYEKVFRHAVSKEDDAFFEKLLSPQPLSQLMTDQLAAQPADPSTNCQTRCITVSLLTISLSERFDAERMAALVRFVQYGEHEVWQRALTGLALTYGKWNRRVDAHPELLRQIGELREIERVQEGLFHFQRFIWEDEHSIDSIQNVAAQLQWHQLSFFEKPQHWFLPFYPEQQEASAAIQRLPYNFNPAQFLQLLSGSHSICNFDKYAICFHLDNRVELDGQTNEKRVLKLLEIFRREQADLAIRRKSSPEEAELQRNAVIFLFLSDLQRFFRFFPKGQYENILERQETLQQTPLTEMLLRGQRQAELCDQQSRQYVSKGLSAFNSGNKMLALEYYKKAIGIKPEMAEVWLRMSVIYSDQGNYTEAIECCQRAVNIEHDYRQAWHNMGIAYYNIRAWARSIECYEKAINITHDYSEGWYDMGLAFVSLPNFAEAERCFLEALRINPANESSVFNLACLYSLQKNKPRALERLARAIELNPANRQKAQSDADFEWLWPDEDFKNMVR